MELTGWSVLLRLTTLIWRLKIQQERRRIKDSVGNISLAPEIKKVTDSQLEAVPVRNSL